MDIDYNISKFIGVYTNVVPQSLSDRVMKSNLNFLGFSLGTILDDRWLGPLGPGPFLRLFFLVVNVFLLFHNCLPICIICSLSFVDLFIGFHHFC